jgi:UDP-2,3-diacylglucosamine pyrophosphatase LpxH
MNILHKVSLVLVCASLIVSLGACSVVSKGQDFKYINDASVVSLLEKSPVDYPPTDFIVFSDVHIFPPALGSGTALDKYLSEDRKLLKESTRIVDSLLDSIKKEPADFVIVTGDLTKDGERVGHELMASYLEQIEDSGKQVYIVPGNHDILNPHAVSYQGDTSTPVPSVTPEQFAQIYSDFGFNQALYRDSISLSYVVEPKPGLWLLALDSCRYKENHEKADPVTDGAFSPDTLNWIEDMLIKARQQNKAVIVAMHHNVVEHYKGEEKYFGEYIVDNYFEVEKLFSAYGVQMVFTGHYHAQDITMVRFPGDNKFLLDIETGSLVTYPSPYRLVQITPAQELIIRTENVTKVEGVTNFPEYAKAYIESGIANIAASTIEEYGVKSAAAEILAKQVAAAFSAHYAGDEKLSEGQTVLSPKGTGLMGWVVVFVRKGMIKELWRDLPPSDNNLNINLETGLIH